MRSAMLAAWASCVTMTMVWPNSSTQWRSRSQHLVAGARVEVAGGLVGEEHGGPGDERAGDGHALLLAAGELGGLVRQAVAEPDGVDELRPARPRRPCGRRW